MDEGDGADILGDLMSKVGTDGKFQSRYRWIFNFLVPILLSMPSMIPLIILGVPDHYCKVPGRELTNFTLDEWKNLTLPMEINPETGILSTSLCRMYNGTENTTTECKYGWEYDRTWYKETITSEENWVCDKEILVANAYVAGTIGEVFGMFFFGHLSDLIGRKPVFFICLTILLTGRFFLAFTYQYYYLFLSFMVWGSTCASCIFQSTVIIGTELVSERKRSQVAFVQSMGWVVGCSLLAFLSWLIADWYTILFITTLPSVLPYFAFRIMPESPLWLASKGKVKECGKVLKQIARTNGKVLPYDYEQTLKILAEKKEKVFGAASLFQKGLFLRTVAMLTCWSVCSLSYYTLVLIVSNMGGNPHLNFFLQSFIEMPAYILAHYLCTRYGRHTLQKWTFCSAILMYTIVIAMHGYGLWGTPLLLSLAKMFISMSWFVIYIQTIEIYPTCLRQSGTSLGGGISSIISIMDPYVVFLGPHIDGRLPYAVLLLLALMGLISSTIIPETANKKLPLTLEEARHFGKDERRRYC